MIYITLGTQSNDFSRCLKEFEKVVAKYKIKEEIVAQTGYTKYTPKNFRCMDFVPETDYQKYINDASVIISHAGSGALFSAIAKHKKIIAVARLAKYGEMVNDHQTELTRKLSEEGYLLDGTYSLEDAWNKLDGFKPRKNDFQCTIANEIRELIKDWIK